MVQLEIPMAPKGKARPRFTGKFAYMPKEYMQWKAEFSQRASAQYGGPVIEDPVKVRVIFRTPTGKMRSDLDNAIGSVLDAIQPLILKNDRQVHEIFTCVVEGKTMIEVTIEVC